MIEWRQAGPNPWNNIVGQGEGPRELMWGGQEPGQKKGESARPRKGREKHEAAESDHWGLEV